MASCVFGFLYYVTTVIGWVVQPILQRVFSWVYDSRAQCVSSIEDPILLTPASELAGKIRKRELTAVQVMEAFIQRVTEVNTVVNAVVAERFEAAIKAALEVDKQLDSKGELDPRLSEENAPLLGVPVSVKEAFALEGMPNTSGLLSRVCTISETDAPTVANLKRAGAIPFVMTNTSELCMWLESNNKVYGCSKNPYNTSRIVGGSSGGEACILAAGGSVIGIGSDIGGSIRMPAFFNGIFGHKPSKGSVQNVGQYPLGAGRQLNLLATGPMCRYSSDLIPMLKVLGGPSGVEKLKLDQPVALSSVRIYTMEDDGGNPLLSRVDPQLRETQKKVADHFMGAHGCQVRTVNISKMKYALSIWSAKMADPAAKKFYELMAGDTGKVNPFVEFLRFCVGMSNHTLPAIALGIFEHLAFVLDSSIDKLLSMCDALGKEVNELLGEDGVLLFPSHPRIAPYHNQPLATPFDFAYTSIFNALELPVTQCPLGLSKEGLPLGIQVITTLNNDRLSLAVAREIEKKFGGWKPPGRK